MQAYYNKAHWYQTLHVTINTIYDSLSYKKANNTNPFDNNIINRHALGVEYHFLSWLLSMVRVISKSTTSCFNFRTISTHTNIGCSQQGRLSQTKSLCSPMKLSQSWYNRCECNTVYILTSRHHVRNTWATHVIQLPSPRDHLYLGVYARLWSSLGEGSCTGLWRHS